MNLLSPYPPWLLYIRGFDPADSLANTRYQVRVLSIEDGADEILLNHVGPNWAYRPGASTPWAHVHRLEPHCSMAARRGVVTPITLRIHGIDDHPTDCYNA